MFNSLSEMAQNYILCMYNLLCPSFIGLKETWSEIVISIWLVQLQMPRTARPGTSHSQESRTHCRSFGGAGIKAPEPSPATSQVCIIWKLGWRKELGLKPKPSDSRCGHLCVGLILCTKYLLPPFQARITHYSAYTSLHLCGFGIEFVMQQIQVFALWNFMDLNNTLCIWSRLNVQTWNIWIPWLLLSVMERYSQSQLPLAASSDAQAESREEYKGWR